MDFTVPQGVRFVSMLGAGSMFEVAFVERQGQRCLCKRIRRGLDGEPRAARAMARERAILERITHSAVPDLIDAGSDDLGPYLVQSIAEGAPLRSLVDRGMPSAAINAVALAAFEALADLHALPSSFVHGDLGPDHVFVGPDRGTLTFIDFGMASLAGVEPAAGERGTLPFVAPEVARGEASPDQPGDVYALAATFAFALLGREPVTSEGAPARLVEISERGLDLSALRDHALCKALAFARAERATTAAAVAAMLRG